MSRAVFLLLPEVHLLDLAGPAQVLHVANRLGAQYQLHYVALTETVMSAQGLSLNATPALPQLQAGDLLFIPGTQIHEAPPKYPRVLLKWLLEAERRGAQMAAICSGAFPLAAAGLLNGRDCTTHWKLLDRLTAWYPAVNVNRAALYVEDGQIFSCAGLASGVDLTLSLLEHQLGPTLTSQVAQDLVVYLRRDGHHTQTSLYLEYRTHTQRHIHRVQDYLDSHPSQPLSIHQLALLANVSDRTLTRSFKAATGITPLKYQRKLRLELARARMHDPNLTVEQIAHLVGFESVQHFRRLWQRAYGGTPSAYRQASQRHH